jgi:hypothetical protein
MNKLNQNLVRLLLLLCATQFTSCNGKSSLSETVDAFLFKLYGGTVFEKPPKVGLKEIHLDDGRLQGKRIVVEGNVETIGDFDSYVIIEDNSARMLVLLNKIIDADKSLSKLKNNEQEYGLRVLGTVFKGKKGLPYIAADALNVMKLKKKGPQT